MNFAKKLNERLKCALNWRDIKRLLVAIIIISLFLGSLFSSLSHSNWLLQIAGSFIFTFFIATSIYLLLSLAGPQKIVSKPQRFLVIGFLIMIGGWIGTFISVGVFYIVFGHKINTNPSWFFTNTVLSLFFGATTTGYFLLRERLEAAVKKLAEKEVNEQRLLRLKTKAELEALRAKVNPHFLFNTLNSIASLIPVEPEKAEEMVQKLSGLFRHTLEASKHELVKLKDELEVSQEYLEIEKARLGKRLDYSIEMDESLADFLIPGFIIQPLVENSVKHGIAPLKSGGQINIQCTKNTNTCQIEISDNGIGLPSNENCNGFGLSGVKERLALYYGDKYRFEISNEAGVRIRMLLPLAAIETQTVQ